MFQKFLQKINRFVFYFGPKKTILSVDSNEVARVDLNSGRCMIYNVSDKPIAVVIYE